MNSIITEIYSKKGVNSKEKMVLKVNMINERDSINLLLSDVYKKFAI
ncbi:MAG: hypothetical protein U9N76_01435 [Candidatus Marinimicrobia bacterium]|nr:hypothetical protein [Candidatus Neomarinimicrobiota bacterium]